MQAREREIPRGGTIPLSRRLCTPVQDTRTPVSAPVPTSHRVEVFSRGRPTLFHELWPFKRAQMSAQLKTFMFERRISP